jgi:hypothetical protein
MSSPSAAQEEMDTAAATGLLLGNPEVFVKNREVVMVPRDKSGEHREFGDLAEPAQSQCLRRSATCLRRTTLPRPLGKARAGTGTIFERASVPPTVVLGGRCGPVNRVVVGDADATGNASDYTPDIRDRVEVNLIPSRFEHHRDLSQPHSRMKHPGLAKKWVDLVTSKEGQRVLEKWELSSQRGLDEVQQRKLPPRVFPGGHALGLPGLLWRPRLQRASLEPAPS